MRKAQNLQNVRINGRKATMFDVVSVEGNATIFQTRKYVDGYYKTAKGVERRYEKENGYSI